MTPSITKINTRFFPALSLVICLMILSTLESMAQDHKRMVRIAKIQVDPSQLDKYNAALKEQMTTAVRLEPGVLSYQALADQKNPANITILEVYANLAAYQKHILTPHFIKYKETVKDMVKALELVDVDIIATAAKPNSTAFSFMD